MKTLKLSYFDYELPQELIAQYPAPLRDSSRLLVLDRNSGKILHKNFHALCLNCPMSQMETLEQAAKHHEVKLEKLLKELNKE